MNDADEKKINIPLRAEVHRQLKDKAQSVGLTMYEIAAAAIEEAVTGEAVTVVATDPEMGDTKADLALLAVRGEIAPLMGIAKHYANLNKPRLATVLYALAAERIAAGSADGEPDISEAVRQLLHTASVARQHWKQNELAEALYQRALVLQPNNLAAKNHLGQLRYFSGDREGAVEYLQKVKDRDNRALLFYGRARYELARDAGDPVEQKRAREDIVAALETWAFGNPDPDERRLWLRQVANVEAYGADLSQAVDELIDYANANSSWKSIDRSELPEVTTEIA